MKLIRFQKNLMFNLKESIEFWTQKIQNMPHEMTSSMYYDFKAKRKNLN